MAEVKGSAGKTTANAKKPADAAQAAEVAAADAFAFAGAGQAAFRDGIDRSAAALGEFGEYGKENLDAVIQSFTVATQGAETLGANVAAFTRKSVEDGVTAAKSLAAARSVQEAVELQADYARAALETYIGEVTRNADLLAATIKDAWRPINDRAALALDPLQPAR